MLLVGKLVTGKFFSASTIKAILSQIWKAIKDFKREAKRSNCFLFSFQTKEDVRYVLTNRPWVIHNYLLVLQEWHVDIALEEISFKTSPFWILGLPPITMTTQNANAIGNFLGGFLESDDSHGLKKRSDKLHIRASNQLDKPFITGFHRTKEDATF